MKTFSNSDIGKIRQENQDCCYTSEQPVGNLPNLFIVADGMGGHNAGRYASSCTVKLVEEAVRKEEAGEPFAIFEASIQYANREILKQSQSREELEGMGTTIVAAAVQRNKLYVANVGDSRLYLVRGNEIRQVTQDHSLVGEMVRMGELDPERAKDHPDRNIITRAIGVNDSLKIDYFEEELEEGDTVLLCSDGLTTMVDDQQIRNIITTGRDVAEKVEELVKTANTNGGKDNITVVIIEP